MKNLDDKSKEVVSRIISRLECARKANKNFVLNLTQEENDELLKIRREFYPQIYRVNDELFFYKGIFLPENHFEIGVLWHRHCLNEAFSKSTLEKIKNRDIIDAGACIGDSAIVFLEFCDKNIHSFEPTRKNYNLMLKTIELNNATRIIPINKGLGSKIETQEMSIASGMGGSSLVFKNSENIEQVELITLDSYVKENNLKIGFIKVDIEGFEQEFLKGARETIETQKPAMLISIYHKIDDFLDIKPMIESWNLGYKFKIIKPIDFSLATECALFCEVE